MIYTSYYAGEIRGEAVSISLYPPKNFKGKHLKLLAPTPELLNWWKSSDKDADAQNEYKKQFREILESRKTNIEVWINMEQHSQIDTTLCCYEESKDFCHRHQIGEELLAVHLKEKWGGEVCMTQTLSIPILAESIIHSATYPARILELIDKCHLSGYPVVCDRLPCDYYHASLHDEDLGDWSELGLLGLLSGLLNDFDRPRLVPSLAIAVEPSYELEVQELKLDLAESHPIESTSLITSLGKLELEQLAKVHDWCNSIKHLMIPSVSQYAEGRLELHLRRFVSLASKKSGKETKVRLIKPDYYPGGEAIEELGESLSPDFHQALVLFYPAGTQIKVHRDSPAYALGAVQINVAGRAKFLISGCQDDRKMESHWLDAGDCLAFDNKQPHGIERVDSDRWCICFFYLKPQYLVEDNSQQLTLSV